MACLKPINFYIFLVLFLGINFNISAQKWEDEFSLSTTNGRQVKVEYKYSTKSCNGGKPNKFRYIVSGTKTSYPLYLNWSFDYFDCNGNYYQLRSSVNLEELEIGNVESLDYIYVGEKKTLPYNITTSSRNESATTLKAVAKTKTPNRIKGPSKIYIGQTVELSQEGGSLGLDTKWVWYVDCGRVKIGDGEILKVSPRQETTYYLRAEGPNDENTEFVTYDAYVSLESSMPTGITGKLKMCRGETLSLTVDGGTLGEGAEWLWYSNGCGSNFIAKGKTLILNNVIKGGIYYVRAVGSHNTTQCIKAEVLVYNNSEPAFSVKGTTTICQGQSVELTLLGGSLADDAVWKCYSASCGGTLILSSNSKIFNLTPYSSTTYYFRAEGYCNTTNCISISVKVKQTSIEPTSIVTPNGMRKGDKVKLSLLGGNLGTNSKWVWYKGEVKEDNIVGEGDVIQVRAKSGKKYTVVAKSDCGQTKPISITLTPLRNHNFQRTYTDANNTYTKAFLHFGIGIGTSLITNKVPTTWISTIPSRNYDTVSQLSGMGIALSGTFHPIMKKWISLGGSINAAFNIGNPTFLNFKIGEEEYSYLQIEPSGELAIGFRRIKALAKYKINSISHDYKFTSANNNNLGVTEYDNTITQRSINLGLRFGSYSRIKNNNKHSKIFDMCAIFSKTEINDGYPFQVKDVSDFPNWAVGIGLHYSSYNRINLGLEVIPKQTSNGDYSYWNLTFTKTLDFFY